MAHIHTGSGQIDYCVNVYVVYQNKVLLRLHEKYHRWLTPGGHVELNETPEDAALREVKEEVGLDVKLYTENKDNFSHGFTDDIYRELVPPIFMNVHKIDEHHRHLSLSYFACADIDAVQEPDSGEKSGGCKWLTKEDLLAAEDIDQGTKHYALKALELLAS